MNNIKLVKFYIKDGCVYADGKYNDNGKSVNLVETIKMPLFERGELCQLTMSTEFLNDFINQLNDSLK